MDIWERKQRLDDAASATSHAAVEWHGDTGDACPGCHVLVPGGFLMALSATGETGCLRCQEAQALLTMLGPADMPGDLIGTVAIQDAQRQIADEFRQHIKAARRTSPAKTSRSRWQSRDADSFEGEQTLHNGWPVPPDTRSTDTRTARVKPRQRQPVNSRPVQPKPHSRTRPPPPPEYPSPSHELLDLKGRPTEADILAAFRRCALVCHPDRGGSVEEFRELIAARDILLGEL